MEAFRKQFLTIQTDSENFFPKVLVAILVILAFALALFRDFDRDEFEAIHTAWKIWSGEVIYVDFFQHHHPFFYYLLIPFIELFGETTITPVVLRIFIFLLFLGILRVSFLLSQSIIGDKRQSWVAVAMILSVAMFTQKAIEIRPDVPQTLLGLIAVFLLLKKQEFNPKSVASLGPLCLGLSFLFLQKGVFIAGAIGLVQLYWVYSEKWNLKGLFVYWLIVIATISPYYIYLIATGQLESYLFWNWTLNMNFNLSFSAFNTILDSMIYNHLIWALFAVGIFGMWRRGKHEIVIMSVILLFSCFVVKAPYRQYFMPLVPVMGIIGANALAQFQLRIQQLALAWMVVIPASYLILLIGKYPMSPQLDKVQWVLDNTSVEDSVYDGNAQFNLFRRDIDYFWFSVDPEFGGLATFQRLENHDYNIDSLIWLHQPKVSSTYFIRRNSSSLEAYQETKFDGLLLRKSIR